MREGKAIQDLLHRSGGSLHDEVCLAIGLPIQWVLWTVSLREIRGFVRRMGGYGAARWGATALEAYYHAVRV